MKRNKRKNKKKGFTLIEILVAVLIIGTLSAIAVPSYMRSVERSRAVGPMANLTAIAKAQNSHKLATSHYTDNITNLDISLRDEESEDVAAGNTFENENFTYKVYGDDVGVATATRKTDDENKQYELSVDYKTNKIYCRPIENKTCIDLGLEEGQDYSQYSQGSPCEGGAGDALAGEGFEAYMASMGANCRINNGVINYSYCEYNGRCEETKIEDGIIETCENSDVNEYNGAAYYNCERISLDTWDSIDSKTCAELVNGECLKWYSYNNNCFIYDNSWDNCSGTAYAIGATFEGPEGNTIEIYDCEMDDYGFCTRVTSLKETGSVDGYDGCRRYCLQVNGLECEEWGKWSCK